ncbi:MAG: fused signal recognition particle receptor [Ulvibacter sp.]|jgi:fused signal recognition particle receptor
MVIFSKKSVKEDIFTQKTNFKSIFSSKKLEKERIEELEDLFISADVGAEFTAKIINSISKSRFNKNINFEEVKKILSEQISKLLTPVEKKLEIKSDQRPYIIVFNGVNGAGKTTTIGKISHLLKNEGRKILIASCDTFRAAANEQLKVWAKRSSSEVVEANKGGEDPSAVAFRSVKKAIDENFDVLLIDTAGRLQNKKGLMEELAKINRIIKKAGGKDSDENILVIDARNGQNIINQISIFDEYINITGLVITKLDGTAKGGILLAITEKFAKPIYAVGVGEKVEDLREFSAKEFAEGLF